MLVLLDMFFHFLSYKAFSIDLYWKASLSLGPLSQGLWLSTQFRAVWTPLGVRLGGVLLCRALDGLHRPVFPLKGWQWPLIIRHNGNLSVQDNDIGI